MPREREARDAARCVLSRFAFPGAAQRMLPQIRCRDKTRAGLGHLERRVPRCWWARNVNAS